MPRYLLLKYFTVALLNCFIVAGAALIVWAPELSRGFNAWTTRVRRSYPRVFQAPTPESQASNIERMIWLYRGLGIVLALESAFALIGIWNAG